MKQSAVEWLLEQLKETHTQEKWEKIIEQALQMEKKQLIDFASEIMFGNEDIGINLRNNIISKYNETFKNK